MKTNFLLLLTFIAGVAVARMEQTTKKAPYDDTQELIKNGEEQMAILKERSEEVNKAVKHKFETMKETIEVLKDEKESLVQQVKHMEYEIVAIKSESAAQPFDVLAIGVPDSTSRK
jgi:chromosome segregation ATPase